MEIKQITLKNLDSEHICCAISELFYDGRFVTNEILSEKSFEKICKKNKIIL